MVFLSGKTLLKVAISLLAAAGVSALPKASPEDGLAERQATNRLVFCHFMIGIVGERQGPQDFDDDMIRAKSLGIDAFALNIGVDGYTDTQLGYAYQSAANNGMKVFISFDFNWYHDCCDAAAVGQKIAQYGSKPAQLMVDGKVFASSFAGDALNVAAMRSAAGVPVFWAPNFHPSYGTDFSTIDGALNWLGWPNNGNNKAPTPGANVTVEAGDQSYIAALKGKPYIAPVSAWFSTHFGPEVSYSKNWVFPSDLLWFNRWVEILALGPRFLEIVTWNDYGESHYIGPLKSLHFDDGNSKWTNDMPHDGWLDMAKPFIAAYHAGATSVNSFIQTEQLIYWYRPTLRELNCDATDTTLVTANNASGNYFMGRPNGWQDMANSVFVVAMLTSPGTVTVISGNNVQSFNAPAGATSFAVDMQVGQQQFFLTRNGQTILSAVSLRDISSICPCGIYNFNAYVGTVPDGPVDQLQHDGLASLTAGLHVSTCSATPSLPTVPIKPTTTPVGGGPGPTTTIAPPPPSTTTKTTPPPPPPPTTTTTTTTPPPPPPPPTTTTSMPPPPPTGTCNAGTGPGNYVGLCNFCCNFGYCPSPCTCTSYGAAVSPPPTTGAMGIPLPGEDSATYGGLCSFACGHGYCPSTACTTSNPPPPPPPNQVCVAGTGPGNYVGLCNFCCMYGYCPPGPCSCTAMGTQIPPPPSTGVNGYPLPGEDNSYLGLCSFSCSHGYCPPTACAHS